MNKELKRLRAPAAIMGISFLTFLAASIYSDSSLAICENDPIPRQCQEQIQFSATFVEFVSSLVFLGTPTITELSLLSKK